MKSAVVFWSGTGNTEAMAQSVAEGVKSSGAAVELLTCDKFNETMIADYDSIAFGCPSMGSAERKSPCLAPMAGATANGCATGRKSVKVSARYLSPSP